MVWQVYYTMGTDDEDAATVQPEPEPELGVLARWRSRDSS